MMIAQNEAHFVQYTIELDTTYNLYLQMFFQIFIWTAPSKLTETVVTSLSFTKKHSE